MMAQQQQQPSPMESRRRRRLSKAQKALDEKNKCEDCGFATTDAASDDDSSLIASSPCEACPYCADKCRDDTCKLCVHKSYMEITTPTCVPPPKSGALPTFTICQVRRHCTETSAWIVAGKDIYDVTDYLDRHPGGRACIWRKAGGVRDCTDDFQFHSKAGRKTWNRYKVGTLVPCPGHAAAAAQTQEKPWWQFWGQ